MQMRRTQNWWGKLNFPVFLNSIVFSSWCGGISDRIFTSVDANESLLESVLMFSDVLAIDDLLPSILSAAGFRTAPTRSLAKRDHDSIRLCASQHAAGPKPLILPLVSFSLFRFICEYRAFLVYLFVLHVITFHPFEWTIAREIQWSSFPSDSPPSAMQSTQVFRKLFIPFQWIKMWSTFVARFWKNMRTIKRKKRKRLLKWIKWFIQSPFNWKCNLVGKYTLFVHRATDTPVANRRNRYFVFVCK